MRLFFLSLFFLHSLFAAESVVKKIEISGNKKIEKPAILSKLRTKESAYLNPDLIQEDIKAIFALGFFDDVQVDEDPFEGGVKLTYTVHEKPTIVKIDFEGNSAIDKEDLSELLLLKNYEVLDQAKLGQSIEKITAKYEEKGYYLAEVRFDTVEDKARNEVSVKILINENDKVVVHTININGNKAVSSDELKKIMQTREGGFFSFLTGSGAYKEAALDRDIQLLQYYYGTLGYVKAQVGKPIVTVSPDKKFIFITFHVEEGEKYFMGKVDFSGDLLFSREELREDLLLVEGETFNTDTLRRETIRYTEKYGDLGYAFANVIPQTVVHEDTKMVDITFEVEKGERVYIGTVTITGNTRTKDKVVRRELKVVEGELYNGTRKRESRENVIRLGFFDNVEFHQTARKNDPRVVDIDIRVKERSTGQLVIGAGYASGNIGFTAQAQLSQNNFLGNGQVASLSVQILTGRQFYEYNLGFQEPYVGYSNWSLGGDLYQLKRDVFSFSNVKTFEETKTGFDIKVGHPIWEFTNLFLTYKLEYSSVPASSIIDSTLISTDSVNGFTSLLQTSLIYDKRDDRLDPRNGLFLSASSEFAGLGGSRKYWRNRGTIKFFHPVVWDFVFRMNLTGANLSNVGEGAIPINEYFIQGGLFSLRGYDFLSIGPKAVLSSNPANLSEGARENNLAGREIVLGGRNELLLNAEVEFPLLKEAKLRGVIFFDAGNSFNTWNDSGNPLYANVGWGFRWFTPIGPLRFEFGYPIVNPGAPKFYFTIGPPF